TASMELDTADHRRSSGVTSGLHRMLTIQQKQSYLWQATPSRCVLHDPSRAWMTPSLFLEAYFDRRASPMVGQAQRSKS
ncbi:hypothetical protein, partial [Rhizobium leguminosarum]|uniref:hypothetical protein n=1 Tax=Rhizobium leguminosarum TaxID=384 RepID=UPI003D01D9C5